jgi:hypothetical protein
MNILVKAGASLTTSGAKADHTAGTIMNIKGTPVKINS